MAESAKDVKATEISEDEVAEVEAKTKARVYHVSYDREDGRWKIFLEGGKAIFKFATKEEALTRVKELAAKNERNYVVHKKDGKMQKKR